MGMYADSRDKGDVDGMAAQIENVQGLLRKAAIEELMNLHDLVYDAFEPNSKGYALLMPEIDERLAQRRAEGSELTQGDSENANEGATLSQEGVQ